jgi:NAD(P)-dependent dehydrogenase (short-subunit alcohol dehydrogenase family)
MDRFKDRNVIVTGASRGIGASIAERMAAEGANVVITARTVDHHDHLRGSLHETLERCRAYGTRIEIIVADLADADSRATIIPTALELFDGRVDVLINNAAAAIYASTLDYPLRRRRVMLEVNFQAPIDLAQAAIPGMVERGEGWIVNVSSGSAKHAAGPPFRTEGVATEIGVYGASKAALNRITNAFALQLYGTGVRINTIEPRAAVMSEGAEILVGGIIRPDQIESMEAMVESVVVLCECDAELTGRICVSLDLLEEVGATVMTLNGGGPYLD